MRDEINLLEFEIDKNFYAIDISYVDEVLLYPKLTRIQNTHECIEGLFILRDNVITAVNLPRLFHLKEINNANDMVIITKVSNSYIALHVHDVIGIQNINKSQIESEVFHCEEKEIKILDLNEIVALCR